MYRMTGHQAEILRSIRTRICLAPPTVEMTLTETALAREFGVSRTPIRQILQLLANAQLVETHTGVGTTSVVLDPNERSAHFAAYSLIAAAAAQLAEGQAVPRATTLELMAVNNMLMLEETPSVPVFVEMNGRVIDAMALTIRDPILCFAMQAAHWRTLRWRVDQAGNDTAVLWTSIEANLNRAIEAARTGNCRHLLETASGLGAQYVDKSRVYAGLPGLPD